MKKAKRIYALLLAMVMLIAILPQIPLLVSAETYSGECGENLQWLFDTETGVLSITGSGTMWGYSYYGADQAPWYTYRKDIQKVQIFDGATSIGKYAFYNCNALTDVLMPDGLTSIGESAFYYCSSLTNVIIPESVTSIKYAAFQFCSALKSVSIPYGVTSIERSVFSDCSSLESVTIPESVTSIGLYAFNQCTSLSELTIPESVKSISESAFAYCRALTSVVIPEGVTTIPRAAFQGCNALTSVTLPDSVTSIANDAFSYCTSLTSVMIPEAVTSIGSSAFAYCYGIIEVDIPKNVDSIGESAFSNCTSLRKINVSDENSSYCDIDGVLFNKTQNELIRYPAAKNGDYVIPDSVTVIHNNAFSNCSLLPGVTIPDGVTSIESYAFSKCSALESVTIPNSVTSLGDYAFHDCDALKHVTIGSGVPDVKKNTFYLSDFIQSYTILNPQCDLSAGINIYRYPIFYGYADSTAQSYAEQNGCTFISFEELAEGPSGECGDNLHWSLDAETCMFTISGSGDMWNYGAFSNLAPWYKYRQKILSAQLPDGMTTLGNAAFSDCSLLENVTLPESLTSIGERAFRGCDALTGLTFGNSLLSIGRYAFEGCDSLLTVTIPSNVTSIGAGAFSACSALTDILVSAENPSYCDADGVLFNKTMDELIQYPAGKPEASYSIPESVTTIGDSAFDYCLNLTSLVFGTKVMYVGMDAFFASQNLNGIYISDVAAWCRIIFNDSYANPLYWGHNLYLNGTLMTDLTIPDGVTSINTDAFISCYSLTSVTIPDSVTWIDSMAFSNCYELSSMTILNPQCRIYSQSSTLGDPGSTVIYGYTDSTAQSYAEQFGYTFVPLEAEEENQWRLATAIEPGKEYVIVADGMYALNNTEVPGLESYYDTGNTRGSTVVVIENGILKTEVDDTMKWTLSEADFTAYDGETTYFIQDTANKYLRRSTFSRGNSALYLDDSITQLMRYYTWSFKKFEGEEATYAMYVNSERAFGTDYAGRVQGHETCFDIPSGLSQRSANDPFAFMNDGKTSRIMLFELSGDSSLMNYIDFTDPEDANKYEIVNQTQSAVIEGEGLPLIATRNAIEICNGQNSGVMATTPEDLVKIPVSGNWTATLKTVFDVNGARNNYYQFFGFFAAASDEYGTTNLAGIRGNAYNFHEFTRLNGEIRCDNLCYAPGFSGSGMVFWLRIAKEGTTYTCSRSLDGEEFTEMFSYEETGINAKYLFIDAYTGMTVGYKFILKTLDLEAVDCGHNYTQTITPPTCTEQGYATYTCTLCGDSYVSDETAALGHNWGAWTVLQAPTATENGLEQRVCARCGETEQRELLAGGAVMQLSTVRGRPGNEVTVGVSLVSNPGIGVLRLHLDYDTARLEYIGFEDSGLSGWMVDQYAVWLGDEDSTVTGEILRLKFKVLDDAEAGDALVTFSYEEGDVANFKEELVSLAIEAGKVTVTLIPAGDITGDGNVNALDLLRLKRLLSGQDVETVGSCDVTGDGKVNALDLLRLKRFLAGEDVVLF